MEHLKNEYCDMLSRVQPRETFETELLTTLIELQNKGKKPKEKGKKEDYQTSNISSGSMRYLLYQYDFYWYDDASVCSNSRYVSKILSECNERLWE